METAYAQALLKTIEGGTPPGKAVHALKEVLRKHGRESLMPRIARAFARVAGRQLQKSGYTLSLAHPADEARARAAATRALAAMGVQRPSVTTRTDDTLVGGWRLEGGDHLIDNSHKKHLLDIYKNVTKA